MREWGKIIHNEYFSPQILFFFAAAAVLHFWHSFIIILNPLKSELSSLYDTETSLPKTWVSNFFMMYARHRCDILYIMCYVFVCE